MPFLQIPIVRIPLSDIAFQRRLKPGEVLRYAVESEWTSPNGHATYAYEMRMELEKGAPEKSTRGVVTRLENLRASYDGHETRSKLFGVIPFEFGPNGPPGKVNAGGAINTFAFPLLAFTLPTAPPPGISQFDLPFFTIEAVGEVKGKARLVAFKPEGLDLALHFDFGSAEPGPVLDCRSVFRLGPGYLLRAEGTYADASGTLTFKIRKL
jgi:hypothetical protein